VSSGRGITGSGRVELAAVLGSGKRFITPGDVVEALGIDPDAAAKRLSRWAADGWVRRVRRGLYIGVPVDAPDPGAWSEDALLVATAVWSPCYFTGWTSANHWALSEQVFRTVALKTAKRIRTSRAQLLNQEYLLAHTSEGALQWGIKSEWQDETRLLFADPGRTVIDVLDDPRLAGGVRHAAEIVSAFLDEYAPEILIDYAERTGNRTVFKRLGYIIEALGLDQPLLVNACQDKLPAGISALDPEGPRNGRRNMRWGLRVNATIKPQEPS
jgi:predicted transcriptional regulator of viral defense system